MPSRRRTKNYVEEYRRAKYLSNYIHEFPSAITKRDLTFDICLVEQVVWYPALVLGVGTKQPFSTSSRARKCFGMRILV